MQKARWSQNFLRKRKMLRVVPLLIVPFLTMAFWALGGGKGTHNSKESTKSQGLNMNLPNAHLKDDKLENKLSFYDNADKDSLKKAELMRSDPYYKDRGTELMFHNDIDRFPQQTALDYKPTLKTSPYSRSNRDPSDEIMRKVALLQKELNKPQVESKDTVELNNKYRKDTDEHFSSEVDRLENMMQVMHRPDSPDHEIGRLEGVLDKILEIQNPNKRNDYSTEKPTANKGLIHSVSREPVRDIISLLDTSDHGSTQGTGFFGIDRIEEHQSQNSIEAVVHETKSLYSGSVVKLRLLNDVYVNGSLVPKDNFVFGIASLNGERLEIEINSIRSGNSVYPIKMQVFDFDGLPGVYIPGAITREVAKQSAENSIQQMEINSLDPSVKVQAAAAGMNAAKTLLSKKVKLVKVTLKAGYKVLLKDMKPE